MTSRAIDVFDSAVHPRMLNGQQIYDYLEPPYDGLIYNSPNRFFHPVPTGVAPYGEWLEQSRPAGEMVKTAKGVHAAREPGSLLTATTSYLRENNVTQAIINPMLLGLIPAPDQGSAICAAYNDWQADAWLNDTVDGVKYFGTIRINPMDPVFSVKEMERWATHPRMLQVGVALESHHPYGQRQYLPIWEAAADLNLPVAIKADNGVGIEYYPTMNGLPRTHIEYNSLQQDRFFMHLASFIAEGVFDRFPGMKVIFQDGGFDIMTPIMWRMDMDWPITRSEVPWVKKVPSEYLREHVRFVANRFEGPPDNQLENVREWAERTDASNLLIYGSGYPTWSSATPDQILQALSKEDREKIQQKNAQAFYEARLNAVVPKVHGTSASQMEVRSTV